MKILRIFICLLPLVTLLGTAIAQEMPTVPPSAASLPLFGEDEAWKVIQKTIPGKKIESEYDGHDLWIFHVLDAKGHECVVTVSEKTRSLASTIVPKLTVKQALSIALKKVPGKRAERRKDLSTFDAKRAEHTFYIDTPKKTQPIQVVTVSDKTGKVVSVHDMEELG